MKNLSIVTRIYILIVILIGFFLAAWGALAMDWGSPALYLLAALGAVAQTLKVEGPTNRTNYSIAWFLYGFTFIVLGLPAAILVILVSHLVEWAWHKYPWYIQLFNIGNHILPVSLGAVIFTSISQGRQALNTIEAIALAGSNLVFVLTNHFLLAIVVKLARNQSFAESGLFEFLTLFLDFTLLSMGSVTGLAWQFTPLASLLNIPPLYLLYQALRVPALMRQISVMKKEVPDKSTS